MKNILLIIFSFMLLGQLYSQVQKQYPMIEADVKHQRIPEQKYSGISFKIANILPNEFEVFIPKKYINADTLDLLVHFHGSTDIIKYAAENFEDEIAAVSINLGAGSNVYSKPFVDQNKFAELLASVKDSLQKKFMKEVILNEIYLSGFSAGYGAVREIIRNEKYFNLVDNLMLLDGIHASYIPEGVNLIDGGTIDTTDLDSFIDYAEAASKDPAKKFLISHSKIYPGSYVSTTEATDYLIKHLKIERKAVLELEPPGMQMISKAEKGGFYVLGFGGDTASDHMDHLHSINYFLQLLKNL